MIYRSTSQKQRELKHCLRFLRLITELILQVCSEPVKLTEVTDKRLLKATPKGRKILLFADNSNYVYVRGVFVASSPMLFGWFESFALQNLQAFSKYEVTNVNVHILLWESVYTSFMSEFDAVGFQIFPSIISLNFVKTAAFKPLSLNHFEELLPIKCFVSNIVFFLVSGVNCEFHRWILKRIFNYWATRIKTMISRAAFAEKSRKQIKA